MNAEDVVSESFPNNMPHNLGSHYNLHEFMLHEKPQNIFSLIKTIARDAAN